MLLALVKQIAVDLVADQPQIVTHAQRRQRLPDQQGKARAGRIIGTVEQHRAGLRRDPRGDIGGVNAKAVFRSYRYRHHRRAARAEHPLVGHVHWLGDDHLVTRIQQALSDRIHRALRAGQHDHVLGIHHLTAAPLVASGDQLAQRQSATHFGIMRIASQQAVDGAVNDRQRRVEIRITHAQQQNVDSLGAQRQRAVMNLPGRCPLPGDALGQG